MARPRNRDVLTAYLWPHRRRAALLAALLLGSTALQLVNPQILRSFIDQATAGASLGDLARLAGLFLVAAVARQIVTIVETSSAENLGQLTTNELRADLTRHCLALDLGFHQLHPPGELIERVDGDVSNLANFFSRFVIQIGGNGLLLVGVLALLFGVTPAIGLAVSLGTIVALIVLLQLRNVGVPRWVAERQARAELFGFLEERLAGTEDLRALGAVDHTLRRLSERTRRLYRAVQLRALVGGSTGNGAYLALTLVTAVGLGLAVVAFRRGEISIGSVYLVYAYTQVLGRPLEEMVRQIQDFQKAAASLERVRDLLATSSQLVDAGTAPVPRGPLAVELGQVSFGYAPNEPVLRDVSLAIRPGEVVGLLGHTGSGKTTLARLIARFYDPDRGWVRIGGVDAREVDPSQLRRAVSVVTQDVHLFHASVRDNLTLFDEAITDERLATVLRQLGLWDWCQALPGGLDAPLAAGTSLSAGEAQLLAFARVFLRDPGVIVLDEASSRLDPATERQIERALDHLLVGRTAVIIAHRLATVERADSIIILEDGEIREQGARDALARDPDSRFARLRRVGLEEALA